MSKLCFVFSWLDESSSAWSGTPKGLYNALSKKVEVRKLNVGIKQDNLIRRYTTKIFLPLFNYSYAKKIINNDENINNNEPYLVFGEYNTKVIGQTYCYQDLAIDYSIKLMQNKSLNYSVLHKLKNVIDLHSLKCKQKEAARFYRNCAGVFTMSDWLKRYMVQNMGISENKVHHVGGGCSVDVSLIDTSHKKGNKFLFVGKDWPRKNGDLVVHAFEKLLQLHPELEPELYIAGPSSPPSSVVDKKNVHFLGRLSYQELAQYYNLCDYFVMPSNSEPYGLVFVEALIFGLPCIGKDCYAMPEFIQNGKNGYLIQDNDVEQLVDAMEKLLLDGSSLSDYVKKQHNFYVSEYSWDNVAKRILTVMENEGFDITPQTTLHK